MAQAAIKRTVLNAEPARQHEGDGPAALAEAFDRHRLGGAHRMVHETERDPDLDGAEKDRGDMD